MTSRLRFHRCGSCLALFALLMIHPRALAAQPGTAPTGDPGGFGIDGDLDPGTPVPGTIDWMSIIMPNGTPTSASTLHQVDAFNSSDLAFFGGSSRLFANPNTDWFWDNTGMTNPLGGRDNFSNGVAHFSMDASGHTWFTWAVDRQGGGGQSYMDVGLYQNSVVRNGNGTFSSAGPHAGHTVGDVVLSLELLDFETSLPLLTVWRWSEVGPGVYDFTSQTPAAGTFFTCANAGFSTSVPYMAFGSSTYMDSRFAEAAIDLSALLGVPHPTTQLRTVLFHSRFGHEIGSVLRDFVEPIQIQITVDVLPAPGAGATRIVRISPNPSRDQVTVEFEIARSGPVSLDFFDVAGRRVGSLGRASFPAGRHALSWNPTGQSGPVRAGVLYARLASETGTDTQRFAVLQ